MTILFEAKNSLKLTMNEYVLCSIIERLQVQKGYCYASGDYLSKCLDVSRRAITDLISKCIEKKVLEKSSKERKKLKLRVTDEWLKHHFRLEETSIVSEKKLPSSREETSHLYNSNIKVEDTVSSKEEKGKENNKIITQVFSVFKKNGIVLPRNIYAHKVQRESALELYNTRGLDKVDLMLSMCKDLENEKPREAGFLPPFDTPNQVLWNYDKIRRKLYANKKD